MDGIDPHACFLCNTMRLNEQQVDLIIEALNDLHSSKLEVASSDVGEISSLIEYYQGFNFTRAPRMGASDRRRKKRSLLKRYGSTCYYCEGRFNPDDLTLDHVIPRMRGGSNKLSNLVLACEPCNRDKGSDVYP